MSRLEHILFVLVVVVSSPGCAQHAGAHQSLILSGRAAAIEAARLDAVVDRLREAGEIEKAMPLAENSLALRESIRGPHHPDVAISLNSLAMLYMAQGAHAKAKPLFLHALAIRERSLGAMHPDVAATLDNLGELYLAQGAYAAAEPLLERALAIREAALGAMHLDVSSSLGNLGELYLKQGLYAKAEPLLVRAVDIREKVQGAMHPGLAMSLNNLAVFYQLQGLYPKAEPLYRRALDICEKALGASHPDVANALSGLAGLLSGIGEYAEAAPLYARALEIREKALGPTHLDVSWSLNGLAHTYSQLGEYTKAEPLYVRALEIREKLLGAQHPAVATSLNNLAELYDAQGAYAKAKPLLERALLINENALGPMHPDVSTSLGNLAQVHLALGEHAKAEPLLKRALDIREKVLGAMHPEVAISLGNLAQVYLLQSAYAEAEPLFLRALKIHENVLGPLHPDVATGLNNLAGLNWKQGAYAKAESLAIRALGILENALGPMHPRVARVVDTLALIYRAQGNYANVMPLVVRAGEIAETKLRDELAPLSESRKRERMRLLQRQTDSVVSLHAHELRSSSQALKLALTMVLSRKGRVLDSLVDNQVSLRAHLTPVLSSKLDQLAAARTELSTRQRSRFDPRTAPSLRSTVVALRARIEGLESELNAASAEFRAQSEPVTLAKIQAALPRATALVEFVRYRRFDPRKAQPWQEERYIAYVLRRQGSPQWVELGEAAPIDASIDTALAAMHSGTDASLAKTALQHLGAQLFGPLRGQLANASHVILSPDGKLNLVPFEALIDRNGRYMIEQRLVSYVTSGRDLLRLAERKPPRSPAAIFAAPDYGPPSTPVRSGLAMFRPLDGALAEVAELPTYFVRARMLMGSQATKAALASTIGPAMVHIVTHGFYVNDATAMPTGSAQTSSASLASPVSPGSRDFYIEATAFASPAPRSSQDPTDALDRAGLAMAGANVGPEGIVSARELASYDWWGTQLVVLSACETGVGAVTSDEGVYGMRRALVLAGAESQVVSLWNVNDSSTQELMRAFYRELARGTGRAEALRQAKLRLLRQPRFAHPYYWAAFVPVGDWTPLDRDLLKPQEKAR